MKNFLIIYNNPFSFQNKMNIKFVLIHISIIQINYLFLFSFYRSHSNRLVKCEHHY